MDCLCDWSSLRPGLWEWERNRPLQSQRWDEGRKGPEGSKGPKCGVCRVSMLGTMALGTYLLLGYLDA